ncbi:MAG: 8-amino-7-oxononanoate synthase [Gammaproteobacteria bacterium]|nr:8-amino-7-oxononanoate synthase [Gammaproteobacteria bacterium]
MRDIRAALQARREQSLYRQRRVVTSPQGAEIVVDGQRLINFASNDYLGLANHPEVVAAFHKGAEQYGVGSGAAHLICGHSHAHHALEEELAAATGRERALLFSTGYMANIGAITALLGRKSLVLEDKLNHASLIDGGLYSEARFRRYQHAAMSSLSTELANAEESDKLIVTDAVFSMDGDIAPLPDIVELAHQHNADVMIDDAHGFGVLGENGSGTANHFGLDQQQVSVYMATLGKAIGSFGAFIAGSTDLIEYLINEARTYVYTTALPPAVAEATRAALRIAQQDNSRREQLQALISRFRQGAQQLGLQLMPSQTPIQPVVLGEASDCLAMGEKLKQRGLLVGVVRPPTVPQGTARLRITLTAAHSENHIDQLLSALEAARV